jgi:hypothetical protein
MPWQVSSVRANKISRDVPRWVLVAHALLAAAILDLAINARNATPNGTTQEARRLANTKEGDDEIEAPVAGRGHPAMPTQQEHLSSRTISWLSWAKGRLTDVLMSRS